MTALKRLLSLLLTVCLALLCVLPVVAEIRKRGDLDGDGKIGAKDYVLVKRHVLGTYTLARARQTIADVDGDGNVTAKDYARVKRAALGTFVLTGEVDVDLTGYEEEEKQQHLPTEGTGKGTADDPYVIRTEADLKAVANYLKKENVHFRQGADIKLANAAWTPLGTEDKPFMGTYDGNGYVISGLKLDSGYDVGLFGVTMKATLKNIRLTAVSTYGEAPSNAGGVVGSAYVTSISGCSVSGTLSGAGHVGLLAGNVYGTVASAHPVVNCSARGTVVSEGSYAGGLIGYVDVYYDGEPTGEEDMIGADIRNCSTDVDLQGSSDVGGLVGYYNGGKVTSCHATGKITVRSGWRNGGLIGEVYSSAEISRCYATGDIDSTGTAYGNAFCGGLIGYCFSRCAVHDCYATGNIRCEGTWSDCQDKSTYNGGLWLNYRNPCGALIGCLHNVSNYDPGITVYNCYATGEVDHPNACTEEILYCKGSLIGTVYDVATVKLIKDEYRAPSGIWYSEEYNIDITEDMLDGCAVARLDGNYCVSDLRDYYTPQNLIKNDNQRAYVGQYRSLPTYKVVTNITEADVGEQSTFAGFDFKNIWKMTPDGPVLR